MGYCLPGAKTYFVRHISASLSSLILLTFCADGRKPAWDDTASLVILIAHFDQLAPLLSVDRMKGAWHGTESFDHDYEMALSAVHRLVARAACEELLYALERVSRKFENLLKDCETIAQNPALTVAAKPFSFWEELLGFEG